MGKRIPIEEHGRPDFDWPNDFLEGMSPDERREFEEREVAYRRDRERDAAFPRDDPPRLTVRYRRTWREPVTGKLAELLAGFDASQYDVPGVFAYVRAGYRVGD